MNSDCAMCHSVDLALIYKANEGQLCVHVFLFTI